MQAGRRGTRSTGAYAPGLALIGLLWATATLLSSGAAAAASQLPKPPTASPVNSPHGREPVDSLGMGFNLGASLPNDYDPVWDFAYAYFPPTQSVVMFGGSPRDRTNHWSNKTWLYGDGTWTAGPAAPSELTARGGAAMAFDPDINKIVMFGGAGPAWPPSNETWLFDGTSWTQGPAAPPDLLGRTGAEMVYDPDIQRIVMVGGSGAAPFNDVWLFDGTQWTKGSDPPADMAPRQFFGMTYDESMHVLVVAGGSGFSDVWYFDGTSWYAGPRLKAGPKERFRLAYDPQLGGDVFFSGLGPSQAGLAMWMLRGGEWHRIRHFGDWPEDRVDGGILWNPAQDGLMLFGGILDDFSGGQTGLTDTWLFVDLPPQVASVTVSPQAPNTSLAVQLSTGSRSNGYGPIQKKFRWLIDGHIVDNEHRPKLKPGPYRPTDQIQAQVQLVDWLGLAGPWVTSDPVTVVDRAPVVREVTITPSDPRVTTPLLANPAGVDDPDTGDQVTMHYEWRVNGQVRGTDSDTLDPSNFQAGDQVEVTGTPVDSYGMSGDPVTSSAVTVGWNIVADRGTPGHVLRSVKGFAFGPSEQVDLRLDSPAGQVLLTVGTDASGSFTAGVPLPPVLPGGLHMLYGIGRTSGIVGPGPFTVTPVGSVSPSRLAAGDPTTFTGAGFVPGETVAISFPGGPTTNATADDEGSVSASLVSPPEAAPGGTLTAVAPSGTANPGYTTLGRFLTSDTGTPDTDIPVTLTGYGPLEQVQAFVDGAAVQSFTTDASGSVNASLLMETTFGPHTVTMTGQSSGVTEDHRVDLLATMNLSPNSGSVGTVVTITSGPGWTPYGTVHLTWLAQDKIADLTADGDGKVSYQWTVPRHGPGDVRLTLIDDALGISTSSRFTIIQ